MVCSNQTVLGCLVNIPGIGSILGVSVATASTIAYAIDAEDALVDDRRSDSQDNPFTILFIKHTLFLLCTKQNPFSIYFIVDQIGRVNINFEGFENNKLCDWVEIAKVTA
ncbi:hypothetical protein QL285_016955 [Trifolium repens]|nr:hypothetical protein QL285_016955 [Trifolium repens]